MVSRGRRSVTVLWLQFMKTADEWEALQKKRRNYPYRKYQRALAELETEFQYRKKLLDQALKKEQKTCDHSDVWCNGAPEGWLECVKCGKDL